MKKFILALAIALMVSGMVFAQVPPDPFDVVFPGFNAVQTESVEWRYSAGTFSVDVDDYIDAAFHNPAIGTFMFLGGYGSAKNAASVSIGFGKTLGDYYLGLFYEATAVAMAGSKTPPSTGNTSTATVIWGNNLAAVFGIAGMGIRLDVIADGTSETRNTLNGKLSYYNITDAPSIAVTWGTCMNDNMFPSISVGFKFPDTTTYVVGDNKGTYSTGSVANLGGGIWYDLSEKQSVFATLNLGAQLPDAYRGDKTVIGNAWFTGTDTEPYTEGGSIGADLHAQFIQALVFGEATIKFKPNLSAKFLSASNNTNIKDDPKKPSVNLFKMGVGLDIGGEYRHGKGALYTGIGVDFFELNMLGFAGGETKNKSSSWSFSGIKWDDKDSFLAAGTLNFGLTFTPINGLVVGAGIGIGGPNINLKTMTLTPGGGTYTGNMSSGLSLPSAISGTMAITVSYKY